MMKLNKIIFFIQLLVLASCAKDLDHVDSSFESSGSKVINFSVESFSNREVRTTKNSSDKELLINRGYIFFFDTKGELKGYEKIDVANIIGNGTNNLSFKLTNTSYNNRYNIICVFNYDKSNYISDFSDLTKDNISSYFPMNSDFLTAVAADLKKDTPLIGIPMFVNDFTDTDKSIHEIYRAIAKFEIYIEDGITIEHESHTHDFHAEHIKYGILNSAQNGNIGFTSLTDIALPSPKSVAYSGGDVNFDYTPNQSVDGVVNPEELQDCVYLYEFPFSDHSIDGTIIDEKKFSTNRISIILAHDDCHWGTTLYYKLNLADKLLNNYFDIERNHHYRIVIKAVNSRGYDTIEEAYAMPPSNIEYEVFDDKGELTLSNGQYAVSMDEVLNYDNIQIYGHLETSVDFNNICYIMPEQMDVVDMDKMTNNLYFEVISSDETLTVETIQNDFETNKKLTADRRSIKLKISGEGSCQIALRIRLGNLDIGRDNITITKHGGDGAFDAHPNQIRFKNQIVDESTWNSSDLDFGAWYDSNNNETVVYMGSNATPTGYASMDGYIAANASKDSYPVFSEKSRTGYYSYKDANGEIKKTKIEVVQLAPFYLGHFGSLAEDGSHTHYNALICEKIEEIEDTISWNGGDTGGYMPFSTNTTTTLFDKTKVYGQYGTTGLIRYLNLVEGREISKYIIDNNPTENDVKNSATRYCYQKNDVNGDGILSPDEPIEWYLPSQNQLIAFWINKKEFETDLPIYGFKDPNDDTYPLYCSLSEKANGQPEYISEFTNITYINMLEGQILINGGKNQWGGYHIRCVRGIHGEK